MTLICRPLLASALEKAPVIEQGDKRVVQLLVVGCSYGWEAGQVVIDYLRRFSITPDVLSISCQE